MNKKANISMNTIFYILMAIMFVWILFFGYNQITNTAQVISEKDRVEIQMKIKNTLEYCTDPLNRGSFSVVNVDNSRIGAVCLLDGSNTFDGYIDDFGIIFDGGDNVALMDFSGNIVSSFSADYDIQEGMCYFANSAGIVRIEINCD